MQTDKKIQFKGPTKDEFLSQVRKRVDEYFITNHKKKTATLTQHIKGLLLFSSFILLWCTLMFGWASSIPRLAIWTVFGIIHGLLAMNVGHDAIHGSYSNFPKLNKFLGYMTYDLVGLSSWVWKQTHNQEHHTFTNISGHDPDINKPGLLRLSPHDPLYKAHRFQHWYIWGLYSLVGLNWILYSDYAHVWKERKKMPAAELGFFYLFKGINLGMILILPLLFSPMAWWEVLVGYMCLQFAGGLTVAIIFQLAHVVENVKFPLPNQKGIIPVAWSTHEMQTTANFATHSPIVTHLFGGLNFQVEHHLFPKIAHGHYRRLSPIVKKTAIEFGLPYNEQPSLTSAVISHARLLKKFGKGMSP